MEKPKGGQDQVWEVGVGELGETGVGKMETTILEQKFKKELL